MSQEDLAPPISAELLAWLDRRYPEKCPDVKDTERVIWIKVGERQLVRRLFLEHERQQEPDYVPT